MSECVCVLHGIPVRMYSMHIKYECVYVYMCVCSLHDVHVLC